ncbi:MAG: PEP-CTERM sorting domain-containing protein [Myxococcales bacterium]|nr:PEP-CTERM sorting domain-containing protein [Myxococcales bacterium]
MVEGVEFTGLLVIDATPAADLVLTTTEDVYVFVPNGLAADTVLLNALEIIFAFGATVHVNELLLCTSDCPLASDDLSVDVLLRVPEPVGNLEVRAGGSIVVSPNPIPEPSTALLLATGVVALAVRRRRMSR